ncbi:MAG: hypothetical protein HRT71_04825 [Flavobacteriales bacterium]|nr:hypothetical protein [Flavobacteriales bacterium]
MIIGRGLVAKSLKSFAKRDDILIFASGVSNSSDTDSNNYEREEKLLLDQQHTEATLVYFSTCSIFDEDVNKTHYVVHKQKMEKLIEQKFSNYLILRLPSLIGKTDNPNTIFNFLSNSIKNQTNFNVHKHAYRYFVDVDDLEPILNLLFNKRISNETINIAFDNIGIVDMVNKIGRQLDVEPIYNLVNRGSDFEINTSKFDYLQIDDQTEFQSKNINNLIEKYISQYTDHIKNLGSNIENVTFRFIQNQL